MQTTMSGHLFSPYSKLDGVFSALAIFGFYNTWGHTIIDGSLAILLTALHGEKPYVLPGTDQLLRTSITGIRWPFDYLLNILIVFFWEAVDGSHPTTSTIGIYFLGQYLSILISVYIDSSRLGHAGKWSLSPVAWLLAFQLMTAATVGPLYAIVYISASPLASELSFPQLAAESLAPSSSTYILPVILATGYLVPAIAMALPSPSLVSNDFQQKAIALWNVFPFIVQCVQLVLRGMSAWVEDRMKGEKQTPGQHLKAVRFAYIFGVVISTVTHVAILSLSASTAVFPCLFRPEYARALEPSALVNLSTAWKTVSTLGDGVRSFLLWDQIFTYSTMLLLGYVQLKRIPRASTGPQSFFLMGLVTAAIIFMGPGSAVLILSWIRDEELFGQTLLNQSSVQAPIADRAKATL